MGDGELQAQIVPLLKSHDRQIQVDRAARLESITIEAGLAACHDAKLRTFSMIEFTRSVNTILAGRGDSLRVAPETVGWKLRALGFRTEFIAGGRKGLKLTEETRERIHILAAAYGVRTFRQGVIHGACQHCDRILSPSAESNL